ncbi:cytochrome b-c1 complex subunit 10-like [Brevipalpus obovatus]|uniref:cytochrome b-c1 complex subunit 10-like n=1 Tax=Brevipalpus obovatus TaxID=246614 RepID=UPI003D9E3A90
MGGEGAHPGPQTRAQTLARFDLFPRMGANVPYKLRPWTPSMMKWGLAGGLFVIYACEWKEVLQYVPIINYRYKKEQELASN